MFILIIVVLFMDYIMLVPDAALNADYFNVYSVIVIPNTRISLKCHIFLSNIHYNYDYVKLFIYIS
jgi:hypothetical protein